VIGNFSSVKLGSSYLSDTGGFWSGSDAGVDCQFNDATGKFTVQAVPEASAYALVFMRVGAVYLWKPRKLSS